jgi:UDP-N-acetylmuramate: L-alanyl-gamma-D-glutamyl-meso-diaminopimelate ligase
MHYHFISIGGAVMHNLALDLLAQGHIVTGSDDEIFDPALSRLKEKGILPAEFGWFPEKITQNIDACILGMHARADNSELLKANELGLPVYSFPEFIYEQSKNKTRVVIGGSHGKTTTTAMIMHVLRTLGKEFDYLVGSAINGFDRMVKMSDAPIVILEGDEYLTSPLDRRPKFLVYHANIAQITGVAWDHINVFPTFEEYVHQFELFINQLPDGAPLAYYAGDEHLQQLTAPHKNRLKLMPYQALPHTVENGETYLTTATSKVPLHVFGLHNLQNMAGAKLLCTELGISDNDFNTAISSFGGTARRLEKIKQTDDLIIFRDFAHSPSKVKATVDAVKKQYPTHNVVACFELHTYSSLNSDFLAEYHQSLTAADEAIVYFNEHVLELKKLPPLDIEEVAEAFGGSIEVYTDSKMLHRYLKTPHPKKTVLLLMSSGNFNNMDLNF